MKLVISEKTTLKKKIALQLNDATDLASIPTQDNDYNCIDGFLVSGLEGHVKDAKEPQEYNPAWQDRSFKPLPIIIEQIEYKPAAEDYRYSKYAHIKKLIPLATEIYHAGDPDREGQAIVDNILDEFDLKIPVYRVWLNDLSNIKTAFANAVPNDSARFKNLRNAARARTIADWLIGMNYSRALTSIFKANGYNENISMGRIQTPTLKLVVDRYRAVSNFTKKYHYGLTAKFTIDGHTFSCDLVFNEAVKSYLDEDGQLTDKSIIERIKQEINSGTPTVSLYSVVNKKERAPLPHTTAKIMSEAVKKFGYSLKDVGSILQTLYENGAIDYPRTDYEYLSEKAYIEKAPGKLEQLKALPQFANTTPDYNIKSRAWDDAKLKAHEGITPISTDYLANATPEEINVFNLIATRFLIQFYPDYEYENTTINIKIGEYLFATKSNTPTNMGWKQLYIDDVEDQEPESIESKLPKLAVDQSVNLTDSVINNKETKPPKLFTEDTLITAMCNVANYVDDIVNEYETITGEPYCDNADEYKKILRMKPDEGGGLGTGATQEGTIRTILDREFIYKNEKNQLIPSNLGLLIIDFFRNKEIIKEYSFLINPITSASYEKQLAEIQDGTLSYDEFIKKFIAETIQDKVVNLEKFINLLPKNADAQVCPICNTGYLLKKRYRDKETQEVKEYFGCSRHPDCKASFSVLNGKPNLIKNVKSEHKCPQCSTGFLIKKVSKNEKTGKDFTWYFCSNYKDTEQAEGCKAKYFDKNGKPDLAPRKKAEPRPTGEKCPKCKEGNIVIREAYSERLKKSFEFKGCDGYPNCDYVVKEKPKKLSLFDKYKTAS